MFSAEVYKFHCNWQRKYLLSTWEEPARTMEGTPQKKWDIPKESAKLTWSCSSNRLTPATFYILLLLFSKYHYHFSSSFCLPVTYERLAVLITASLYQWKLVLGPSNWKIFTQRSLRDSHNRTAFGDLGNDQSLWFPREGYHNKVLKVKAQFYTEQEVANFDFLVGSQGGHQD